MAVNYAEAFKELKKAKEAEERALASAASTSERKAALQLFFYHLSQAANLALRLLETSFPNMSGSACEQAKREASDITTAQTHMNFIWQAPEEDLAKLCNQWYLRCKSLIEKISSFEAAHTDVYSIYGDQKNLSTGNAQIFI